MPSNDLFTDVSISQGILTLTRANEFRVHLTLCRPPPTAIRVMNLQTDSSPRTLLVSTIPLLQAQGISPLPTLSQMDVYTDVPTQTLVGVMRFGTHEAAMRAWRAMEGKEITPGRMIMLDWDHPSSVSSFHKLNHVASNLMPHLNWLE
jgi:hypothetical protein